MKKQELQTGPGPQATATDKVATLRSLAEAHLKGQDWPECIEACRALLKLAPRHHFARETLATALLQTGQIEEAIGAVEHLLELSPRDPLHRLRLATLLQMQGRHGEALMEFERILAMYPDASFTEDAQSAIENLDRLQTQQILLMAAEQDGFRWLLERDTVAALESNNFYLSENGYESLRQMIPGSEDEGQEPGPILH